MKSSISDLKKMIKSMNIEFLNGNISGIRFKLFFGLAVLKYLSYSRYSY